MLENFDVFNVGRGQGDTVLELINTFEEINELKLSYKIGPRRDGDIKAIYADTSKINQILNWNSRFSLKDSLKHSWEWEKNLRNL
jgi:UDP-glucose 4-epimerase